MHDNARPHTATATKAALEQTGIPVIEWPPGSPDLNPIEHVWMKMKQHIHDNSDAKFWQSNTAANREELQRLIQQAWDSITPEFLGGLVDSMPARCQAVLDAQGGPTPY